MYFLGEIALMYELQKPWNNLCLKWLNTQAERPARLLDNPSHPISPHNFPPVFLITLILPNLKQLGSGLALRSQVPGSSLLQMPFLLESSHQGFSEFLLRSALLFRLLLSPDKPRQT